MLGAPRAAGMAPVGPAGRRSAPTAQGAGAQQQGVVLGFGSCCVDYMAQVAAFPELDSKNRTERLQVCGGGNAANALTAAARLGLPASLASKVGADAVGDQIAAELAAEGVGTQHLLRARGDPSPLTYIIVDRQGGTRTCIHTPGPGLEPQDFPDSWVEGALQDAALCFFDGRLAEAGLRLVRGAREKGIPVVVEAERLRPGLEALLQHADHILSSRSFPEAYTGEDSLWRGLLALLRRFPHVKWVSATRGPEGAILVERQGPPRGSQLPPGAPESRAEQELQLDEALIERALAATSSLQAFAGAGQVAGGHAEVLSGHSGPAVLGRPEDKRVSREGGVLTIRGVVPPSALPQGGQAQDRAAAAAALAAAQNADASNAHSYGALPAGGGDAREPEGPLRLTVHFATSAGISKAAIEDTTGAGDAYNGAMLYGLVSGLSAARALQLAAVVAAAKCSKGLGARQGLPRRDELCPELL